MPISLKVEENMTSAELPQSTNTRRTSTSEIIAVMTSASWCGRVTPTASFGPKVTGVAAHAGSSVHGNEAMWLIWRAYARLRRFDGKVCALSPMMAWMTRCGVIACTGTTPWGREGGSGNWRWGPLGATSRAAGRALFVRFGRSCSRALRTVSHSAVEWLYDWCSSQYLLA